MSTQDKHFNAYYAALCRHASVIKKDLETRVLTRNEKPFWEAVRCVSQQGLETFQEMFRELCRHTRVTPLQGQRASEISLVSMALIATLGSVIRRMEDMSDAAAVNDGK